MASNSHLPDRILHALGPLGKFTILQVGLVSFCIVPTAIQLLTNVFIGFQVSHRCARPENESIWVSSLQGYENLSITYKQCVIKVESNETVVKTEACIFGVEYDQPLDYSFISTFGLVCEYTNLARLAQTLVIGGQGFGAVTGCLIADKFGRRTVIIASNAGLLVTGVAIAYSSSYTMFAILKFIVGCFQQSGVAVNTTILLEMMVIKDRRLAAVFIGLVWAGGVILLDVISFALKGHSWRTIQLVLSLVSVFVFVQWWYLRESLRWLMANGRTKEITSYIKCAARVNGKNAEDILNILKHPSIDSSEPLKNEETGDPGNDDVGLPNATEKLSYLDIFRNKHLFLNILMIWMAWFTTAFGFFALYLTATSLAGDKYLNFFLTALMEIPSNILFYFGLNRYGRRTVLLCVFSSLSIGLIGSGIFRSFEQTITNSIFAILFAMIAMGGASGCFGIVFHYTPELFPTNIRNQSLGICSMVARIGGMLAPFTGILSEKAKWGPGLLIGCLASIVALLTRFLPETRGRELPQTLKDFQAWFEKDNNNINDDKSKKNVPMVI